MADFTLDDMIRNNISLLSPAEPGLTWAAEAPLFESRFLVEHIDPKEAVLTVLRELESQGQLNKAHPAQTFMGRSHSELLEIAKFHFLDVYKEDAGYCPPEDAIWSEVSEYPLERLFYTELPDKDTWCQWLREELERLADDDMNHLVDEYRAMINEDIEEAIVIVEIDGKGYIWDGCHRTAASFAGGKSHIPAIVGRPFKRH